MKKSALMTALAVSLTGTMASAAQYNANHFFAERHSMVRGPYGEFAKKVAEDTNGEVTFKVFSAGSLLPPASSLGGLRDGIAQVSYHAGTYTPAELPVANLIGNMAFYNTDPLVMAFASTEFGLTHPAALTEWKKNGIVFGGGYSTSEYHMQCNTKVETLADVQGKKLRMPGGAWSRFAEHIGALPVSIPSSEMYSGLDVGVLDCAVAAADALDSFSLKDVVTAMNTLTVGNYYAGFEWAYNADFWKSISPENRKVLFDQMAYYLAEHRIEFDADVEKAVSAAKEKGMVVYEPDQALQDALAEFVKKDEATLIATAEDRGVENPAAILADFKQTIDRWDALLEGIDRQNVDVLAELARTEIYDKLDPATYGTD
ncbi:C4-dicarboxylate ABC transporter substrate-binding protein (plasmid) [Roseibium aggregatum]|jgi:TRAP-type transport system periplasmic protein|uniref:C4-dicarboxylate TRAP transporter substrate-binding protein n=1 Tax=Roseibium aggregatum TaxID=187304 RepID=UPI001E56A176|nr:C4-dicarboxylate TRAP transporter substrate-binding protein [Roseibium aggregatum]UES59911.1 C4-dicarboxylate ABC transporter substrate-binding protein [Roseibium aggregatum]